MTARPLPSPWLALVAVGLALVLPATAQTPGTSEDDPEPAIPCPPGAYCEPAPWSAAGGGSAAERPWSLDPTGPPRTGDPAAIPGVNRTGTERHRGRRSAHPLSTKPDRLPYEPGDPIPPGYRREKIANDGLFFAGAGVLALSYLPWLAIGLLTLESDDPSLAYVAIPLVGPPLLALQYDLSATVGTLLVANGAVQGLGIALMIAAELTGENVLIRDARRSTGPRLAPWAGRDSAGVQLVGAL